MAVTMEDIGFNLDLLGGEPKASFFSFQNQFGKSPNQRRFFQNQYETIMNEFLGAQGQQLRQGMSPQELPSFVDFLGPFNFADRFASTPPSARGARTSRFSPRAVFDFFG
jgi:hypothetical protein